jgi:hypothetical protein
MNEKLYIENFEIESLMIESGIKPIMTVDDLTDAEKENIFENT